MFEHRQKIALAVALVFALGSAAASAANYFNGKGGAPSFAGAGDAMGMALSMAGKTANWLVDRSRTAISYLPPSRLRSPEQAESASTILHGPFAPAPVGPSLPYAYRGSPRPDLVHPQNDEGFFLVSRPGGVPPFEVTLPTLSGGGGIVAVLPFPAFASLSVPVLGTTPANAATVPAITPAVPEIESYVMLLAGLGVLGMVARRRGRPIAA